MATVSDLVSPSSTCLPRREGAGSPIYPPSRANTTESLATAPDGIKVLRSGTVSRASSRNEVGRGAALDRGRQGSYTHLTLPGAALRRDFPAPGAVAEW